MTELDRLVAEYLQGEQDRLANIKTVWLATKPRPEGTWGQFCKVRLHRDRTYINRRILGKTGNEARNVNSEASDASLLQKDEPATCALLASLPVFQYPEHLTAVITALTGLKAKRDRSLIKIWIEENW